LSRQFRPADPADVALAEARRDFAALYDFLQAILQQHGFADALAVLRQRVEGNACVWQGPADAETKWWVMKETAWWALEGSFPEAHRLAQEYLRMSLGTSGATEKPTAGTGRFEVAVSECDGSLRQAVGNEAADPVAALGESG
jgi:hypothetical protein